MDLKSLEALIENVETAKVHHEALGVKLDKQLQHLYILRRQMIGEIEPKRKEMAVLEAQKEARSRANFRRRLNRTLVVSSAA